MDLPTYTNIWRIEKRLYKLYDFRLPAPLPISWIAVFAGITVPYIVFLVAIGLPFNHDLVWLYVLPPGVLTWLTTRPVIENKRLPELLVSQVRYLAEPRVWCRMAPLAENDEIVVVAKVWHSRRAPAQRKANVVARRDRRIVATRAPGNERGTVSPPLISQPRTPAPAAPALVLGQASTDAQVRARAVARGGGPRHVGRVEVAHGDAAMRSAAPSSFAGLPAGTVAPASAPPPQAPPADAGALPAGAMPPGGDGAARFAADLAPAPARETDEHQTRQWFEGVRGPTMKDAPAPARADDKTRDEGGRGGDDGARDDDGIGAEDAARDDDGANDGGLDDAARGDDAADDDRAVTLVEAAAADATAEVEAELPLSEVVPSLDVAPPPPIEDAVQPSDAVTPVLPAAEAEAVGPAEAPAATAETPAAAAETPAPAPAPAPTAPPAAPRTPVVPVTVVRALSRDRDRPVPSIERALGRPGRGTTDGLGWRRKVKVVAGAAQGPGKRDQEALDSDRARLPLAGPKRILVLGCTGGAGQTVTALMTGYILASLREHPVAAVDLHDGGLAHHASPAGQVKDLLNLGRASSADARPVTAPDGLKEHARTSTAPLDVIVSDGEPLGEADVATLARILAEHYPLVMLDPGPNGLPRLLHIADQLVLVAPADAEGAQSLAGTRDWLDAHGFGDLVARSVTLINGVSRRSMADVEQTESVARGRCRAIVRVPWDDQLPVGAAGPSALLPQTRVAYTALAGVVIAGLAAAPVRAK